MDIIKKINLKSIRATHESFNMMYKLWIAAILISLTSIIFPHNVYAQEAVKVTDAKIVFEVGDHTQYISEQEEAASFQYRHETAVAKLQRQLHLGAALKSYLESKGSPLADYASTLIQQNNWKKIIALSNAESSMCRKYIPDTENCWGVGGSNLWDMGDDLGEGIVTMNNFLNNYPAKSQVKYTQMNFEQMNGLYKQPPADHWVYNNLEVYNELTSLERSVITHNY